jgi:hypothetical protein
MYHARHRAVAEILCFASENSCISINNLYLFYEARPSKTGRGEGGLLCVRN